MGNYVDFDDLLKEGIPPDTDPIRAGLRIDKWEGIVEQLTGNVFRVVQPGELIFDGNDSNILHFNLPLVEIVSIYVNSGTTELEATDYRAYTGMAAPKDDRYNPKIELTGVRSTSLFTSTYNLFLRGYDQKITAKWGFVEPDPEGDPGDYRTPPPVKQAIVALVVRDLNGYFEQYAEGQQAATVAPVKREKTDDHEVEYQAFAQITWSVVPPDIREVLMMYRCPIAIEVIDPSQGLVGVGVQIYGA